VSNAPDRSHLADAIHLIDSIQTVDSKVPAVRATVDRSKAAVVSAKMELDQHERWLERHQELYSEAVKGCERRLKRQRFISACKQTALLPIHLLASACVGLFHAARAYPHRFWLRAKLQNRIHAMDSSVGGGSQSKNIGDSHHTGRGDCGSKRHYHRGGNDAAPVEPTTAPRRAAETSRPIT